MLQRVLSNPGALTPEVLGETMEQYLMAKLGWERSQLTRDAVRMALLKFDATLAEEWDQMWVACEMVRYGASSGDLSELSNRMLTLAETTEATWNS